VSVTTSTVTPCAATNSTMSGVRRGLGWPRRLLRSYFCATSRRYLRKQRIRRHQRVDLRERLASELLRGDCESTSLSVRVADAAASKLLAEHRVLREQVFGDELLVSRHPSGQGQHEKLQRRTRHRREASAACDDAHQARTRSVFGTISGWHHTGRMTR
jgi:hypothetical protein